MNTQNLITKNWTDYFKPLKMDDILSHESIISTLKKCIEGKYLPHLLFYGSPGTGKTTTIVTCAKELYKEMYDIMVLEINASEERGIEMVRSKIKSFATTKVNFGNPISFKLIILDEADSLTADAQGMLRLVIEKYTTNVRFCLICNYIKNINPAILSRCTLFKFTYIKPTHMKIKINEIIKKLNINIDESGCNFLIKLANGDMRKLLNMFQMVALRQSFPVSSESSLITEKIICESVGYPDRETIKYVYEILCGSKLISKKIDIIDDIITKNSYHLADIISELTETSIKMLLSDNKKLQETGSIFEKMSKLENNLAIGSTNSIQLAALVSTFRL
jgi:replication factor C subunit 3/5